MSLQSNSTLSFVRKFLNFLWVMAVLGVIVSVVVFFVILLRPGITLDYLELGLGWWGPGVTLRIPSAVFTPDLVRKACIMAYGTALSSAPVGLVILYELKRILSDVAGQTPFTLSNATRIRHIGYAVLAGAAITNIRDIAFASFISRNVRIPGVDVGVKISLQLEIIGIGLLILILAEVFRYGVRLQEDQDLTV